MKRKNGFLKANTMLLAAGLLTRVEQLLRGSGRSEVEGLARIEAIPVNEGAIFPEEPPVSAPEALKTDRHFSIKRSKSGGGDVDWILEGYGKYKCLVVCRSWEDAVAQAKARLAAEGADGSPLTLAAGS